MAVYRPNGEMGPVCDPPLLDDEELSAVGLSTLIDPQVGDGVVVDLTGQSGSEFTGSYTGPTAPYFPFGTMGPACDPKDPTTPSDALEDADPLVQDPFVPEEEEVDPYTGPTQPYYPAGPMGPACDPKNPNVRPTPENVTPAEQEEDETTTDEPLVVNPAPPPTVVENKCFPRGLTRPENYLGPICDPAPDPRDCKTGAEDDQPTSDPDDFDPDDGFPGPGDFPDGWYNPDTGGLFPPTIGLPPTSVYDDGIDIGTIENLYFKFDPLWNTDDVNQIPNSFTFDDPDTGPQDWDWGFGWYNGGNFNYDTNEVWNGLTWQEMNNYIKDSIDDETPSGDGDTSFFQAQQYCEEPFSDIILDPDIDGDGNKRYYKLRSRPRTYKVDHEIFDEEFKEKSAWISHGHCSFEGKTRLIGNAANFSSPISIPSTDQYCIRYKFYKRGEIFLNYFGAPIVGAGEITGFLVRTSAFFTDPETGEPDPDNSEGGAQGTTSGAWHDDNTGYRVGSPPWTSASDSPIEVTQGLVYKSGSGTGSGAVATIKFSPWEVNGTVYTKYKVKSVSGGSGYRGGDVLSIPLWNNWPGTADRLIKVTSVSGPGQGSPDATITLVSDQDGAGTVAGKLKKFSLKSNYNVSPGFYERSIDEWAQITGGGVEAVFSSNGKRLEVTGSGTATVSIKFTWDDNPNTKGQAVGTAIINGVEFSQGNNEEGSVTKDVSVTGGQNYTIQYLGQSSSAGPKLESDGLVLKWDDDANNGFDENAKFEIKSVLATSTDPNGFWTALGEKDTATVYLVGGSGSGAQVSIQFKALADDNGLPNNTQYRIREIIDAGTGYLNGDKLKVPAFGGRDYQSLGNLIRVDSTETGTFNDRWKTTCVNIEAGEYEITTWVENYTVGTYQALWKDSPAACAIEIFQGSFNKTKGEIPCNIGISESSGTGTASFNSSGDLVVTGHAEVEFTFEWDDDAATAGTALTSLSYSDLSLTFSYNGQEEGSTRVSRSMAPGTYAMSIQGNSNGFAVQNSGEKLCFYDGSGTDCNAELRIKVKSIGAAGEGITFSCGSTTEIEMKLTYDDDPDTQGLALSEATWTDSGITLVRDTNKEEGSRTVTKDVASGTYPFVVTSNAGGYNASSSTINLLDGGGNDVNATIRLKVLGGTGADASASFDSNGNLVVTGGGGWTNSYIAGTLDRGAAFNLSHCNSEYVFTATDPAKGMSVQIGLIPRVSNNGGTNVISVDAAVKEVYNYGFGYAVDETWTTSYTGPVGGSIDINVKVFSTRKARETVGNLIWSTKTNAVGYDTSSTPFDD